MVSIKTDQIHYPLRSRFVITYAKTVTSQDRCEMGWYGFTPKHTELNLLASLVQWMAIY